MEYVCDFCESIVEVTDSRCKVCGAKFSEIKCPACSYKGKAQEFKKGCPKCKFQLIALRRKKKPFIRVSLVTTILLVLAVPLMILTLYRML